MEKRTEYLTEFIQKKKKKRLAVEQRIDFDNNLI
jgi:hypothetical protein